MRQALGLGRRLVRMTQYSGDDFYCDVAIPRREPLEVVFEGRDVLAFRHTRPFWPVRIVVAPQVLVVRC